MKFCVKKCFSTSFHLVECKNSQGLTGVEDSKEKGLCERGAINYLGQYYVSVSNGTLLKTFGAPTIPGKFLVTL